MKIYLMEICQALLFLILSPLLAGWIKTIKCVLQNRRPPSIFQAYRNLIKLFLKQVIVPQEASWIFRFTPYLIFSVVVLLSFIVPLIIANVSSSSAYFSLGDVIVLVGLLALGRFFLVLSGLDIGTTFGGMGSSREMMISSLAEPSTLLVFFTLAIIASSTNLSYIVGHFATSQFIFRPSFIFALLALCMITLAETGRIPLDNPTTHLELTMVHEAMILEYSGRYLGLIEWSAQIKLMIYFVLISNIFFPWGIATDLAWHSLAISFLLIIIKLAICGVVLAVTEMSTAKLRLFKAPNFLSLAFVLCLLAIFSHVILGVG